VELRALARALDHVPRRRGAGSRHGLRAHGDGRRRIDASRVLLIDSLTAQKRLVEAASGALVPESSVVEEAATGSLAARRRRSRRVRPSRRDPPRVTWRRGVTLLASAEHSPG